MRIAFGWLAVGLTLLAVLLRVYRLEDVPLRGDEAFTVRFWTDNPIEVWDDLATREPHPMGAFVLFWAWKNLVGDSEFSMRALSLLLNLPGVALMMVLAQRLIRKNAAVWMAGLLWAVNPFLVWHAQDARNYAMWASLSALAMWLFLRAVQRNQKKDWVLYGAAEIAALYIFLLEPFFLLVQLLYLLLFYRQKIHLRRAFTTWFLIGLAALPLLIQISRLSGSGYEGTAQKVTWEGLVSQFLPTLLFGEIIISGMVGAVLLTVLLVGLGFGGRKNLNSRVVLIGWIFLPLLLLMVAGTQMSVFRPRYVIAITPAVILGLLWIGFQAKGAKKRFPPVPMMITGVLVALSLYSLYDYYFEAPPKSPDWRGLTDFIEHRDGAGDLVVTTNVDPAFGYYYDGTAGEVAWLAVEDLAELVKVGQGVFVQVGDNTFEQSLYLQENAQLIPPASALVKQYRPYFVTEDEIEHPLDILVGDVAMLRGYTINAADEWGLTVFLYWQPLQQTDTEHVAFVHVLDKNGTYVTGDDHVPLNHNASTTAWLPDSLLRDPFYVNLPPGNYQVIVGMYDSTTQTRLEIEGGDRWLLGEVEIRN